MEVTGYYRVKLDGVATLAAPSQRTGEQRLATIEKTLKKYGIGFVEDFDTGNVVVVRYGMYADDTVWAAMNDTGNDDWDSTTWVK